VPEPLAVLADEPTANLDSRTGGEILELMSALNETKQVTFVFSTHDPRIIRRARRVLGISDGVMTPADPALAGEGVATPDREGVALAV
jgi:putative ABC transport system ATP-binding protein